MSDTPTNTGQPARRRFAPVPIETTFERFRKGPQPPAVAPAGELTPSPSPQSTPMPPPSLWTSKATPKAVAPPQRHRFKPWLIETSRRSRRNGDIGPATRPTDKTDITPHENHIYSLKARKRHRKVQSLARRESCDEETAAHVFQTMARELEKQMMEEALAVFPNSRARAGGAEHFVIREGSDDDDSSGIRSRDMTGQYVPHTTRRSRRDSSTEDVGWALRELQEHHEQLSKVRAASVASDSPYIASVNDTTAADASAAAATATGTPDMAAVTLPQSIQLDRIATIDLDQMSMESPPNDPIWTTTARQSTHDSAIQPIGESFMPFIPEEPLDLPGVGEGFRGIPSYARKLREAEGDLEDEDEVDLLRQSAASSGPRPIGETAMPYIPPPSEVKMTTAEASYASDAAKQIPLETGFRGRNAYAGYRNRDLFASERDVHKLRKKSPPLLGKELVFPKCASPKQTKLVPTFLWSIDDCVEKSHKDDTGKHGLWNGLCFSTDKNQALLPIERPALLATPLPPSTPGGPFSHKFSQSDPGTVYAEPSHVGGSASATTAAAAAAAQTRHGLPHSLGAKHQEPKGLHMLAGLDERLRQEKAAAELEESIAAEFTDRFVTQVYNYLSLGYPSMAWPYDDELAKISRIPVAELERGDSGSSSGPNGSSGSDSAHSSSTPDSPPDSTGSLGSTDAEGHISLEDDDRAAGQKGETSENGASYNHDSSPRWRALKIYILEWARQHPDLNSVNPLAWGVRERRGSWGV